MVRGPKSVIVIVFNHGWFRCANMMCGDVRYVKVYFYDDNDKKGIVMDNLIFKKIWQDENLIDSNFALE